MLPKVFISNKQFLGDADNACPRSHSEKRGSTTAPGPNLGSHQNYCELKKTPEVWVPALGILMSCRVPAPDNGSLKSFPAAALPSTPVLLGYTFQLKPRLHLPKLCTNVHFICREVFEYICMCVCADMLHHQRS